MATCSPCLDLSGVPPGKPPLSLHRTGKDVMPFRQGLAITRYMSDYIPPALMPDYQGHIPTLSTVFGDTYGGATKKYFKGIRQDVLTKHRRPSYVYGRLPCDFTPFPDVAYAHTAISSQKLQKQSGVTPTNVDKCRTAQLQDFHDKTQAHRDYYLDKTDRIYPEPYFNLGRPYPTRCPVDERVFKIKQSSDQCDRPGFLGPSLHCNAMPCINHHGMLNAFKVPKLPRPPFQCCAVKPKDPLEHEVLLV